MASQWYCQVLGEELGPLPWPDLVEMVRSGTVSRSDLVRREASGPWEPAEKVVGLFLAARETGVIGEGERPDPVDVLKVGTKAPRVGAKRKAASADAATALLKSLANG